jgi:hypothetical protein
MSTAIIWTGIGLLAALFLHLWPDIQRLVMEIVD